MKIKGLKQKLNALGIHNNYNLCAPNGVFLDKNAKVPRSPIPASWGVYKIGKNLGKAWYDFGAKTFSYLSRTQAKEAEREALAFAETTFHVKMVKSPFGGYVQEDKLNAAIQKITENSVEAPSEYGNCTDTSWVDSMKKKD